MRKKKRTKFGQFVAYFANDIAAWCAGRWWQARVPLLLLMAFVFQQHLTDSQASDFIAGLNLGIHEMGHYVFGPFGEFMTILGGSLFQCLVPIGSMFMFLRQRDYFAIAFAFGWLSTNLFSVATYVADARMQELPLVSPGMGANSEEITHDWHWLLEHTHLLLYDHGIAQLMRLIAALCMLICLVWGSQLCWLMYKTPRDGEDVTLH
jgi:hypothetical protein